MAIIEIPRSRMGSKSLWPMPYASVSKVKEGNASQIIFSVNRDAMKDLRWVIGDKIRVTFDDESHLITMSRTVSNTGYALCGKAQKNRTPGTVASASIRVTTRGIIKPTELTEITKEDCVIDGTSITFIMPGQS